MGFREREKQRIVTAKPKLFSGEACEPGLYRKRRRKFCLREDRASENLHASIRGDALDYFRRRGIRWHDGKDDRPSNHLCCSQSFCVNFWFPFRNAPGSLTAVLRGLGYDVAEVLPFKLDRCPSDSTSGYVAFEWIGKQNYLAEGRGGKVVRDDARKRGQHFTSLDFACRFLRTDGAIQMVAGEWKYTERYANNRSLRFSRKKTDRLRIYESALSAPDCQIKLGGLSQEALFFDPFDQLMRQQLLCSAMEREGEMDADIVSLLHIAPKSNRDFVNRVTSSELRSVASDVHGVWSSLVGNGRFAGVYAEDVLPLVCRNAPEPEWASYMTDRYGGMR